MSPGKVERDGRVRLQYYYVDGCPYQHNQEVARALGTDSAAGAAGQCIVGVEDNSRRRAVNGEARVPGRAAAGWHLLCRGGCDDKQQDDNESADHGERKKKRRKENAGRAQSNFGSESKNR